MRRNKSADCYPFHGGRTATMTTINTIGSSRGADTHTETERSILFSFLPKAGEHEFVTKRVIVLFQ
jgi:hypothetical protein